MEPTAMEAGRIIVPPPNFFLALLTMPDDELNLCEERSLWKTASVDTCLEYWHRRSSVENGRKDRLVLWLVGEATSTLGLLEQMKAFTYFADDNP